MPQEPPCGHYIKHKGKNLHEILLKIFSSLTEIILKVPCTHIVRNSRPRSLHVKILIRHHVVSITLTHCLQNVRPSLKIKSDRVPFSAFSQGF